MAESNMTVRITAVDEVTPTIKRIQRAMWWHSHGEGLMRAVTALLAIAAFLLGRVTA